MARIVFRSFLGMILLGFSFSTARGVEPTEALKRIPSDSNAIVIVKIQDLLNSPRGKKENWAKKHQTEFLAGAVHVPPSIEYVVRGFEFHPEDSRVTKSYGIAASKQPLVMTKVAEHEKGRIETIAGHTAILTDRNSYFTQLSPTLVGVVSPAYRQDLARWVRQFDTTSESTLSTYLKEISAESINSHVLLALDFQDLVDPKSWRERIKSSSAVVGKPNAVTMMSHLADSIRGISLQVQVAETTTGAIHLDFGTAVSQAAKPFIKPVLIDLLGEAGATLADLDEGEVTIEGKRATVSFGLSDAGLRQVMSLVLMPGISEPSSETTTASTDSTSVSGTGSKLGPATAAATRTYFSAVNQVFDDLAKLNKHAVNYNRTAVWHENFAKKIDQLSIRNVDPDLVIYGSKVASNLRALAVSLRGVPITVNQLEGAVSYNVNFQTGGYMPYNYSLFSSVGYQPGYVNVETNQAEVRGKQAEAIAAGVQQREQIWQILADDRQKIRIQLVDKFGSEFDARP